MDLKDFYPCPGCGRAISRKKRDLYICPNCGEALFKGIKAKEYFNARSGNHMSRDEEIEEKVKKIDKRIIEVLWTILLSATTAVIVVLAATG